MTEVSDPLFRGSLTADLRPLSALLWQAGVAHRIVEVDGAQQVILAPGADRQLAGALLQRWQTGEVTVRFRSRPPGQTERRGAALAALTTAPVTATLVVLGVLGFALIFLSFPVSWLAALTYQPFTLENGRIVFLDGGGPWRLVTPVFLHFGWLHIVFNALWCWELGKRIERQMGSVNLLGLFLVVAIVSNIAQHLWSGPVLFGGLSGVVYGFLGFAWSAGRLNPAWAAIAPSNSIMLFMVGWLLVCMFSLFELLGFSVANAAHLGGLLTGLLIGAVFALAYRRRA